MEEEPRNVDEDGHTWSGPRVTHDGWTKYRECERCGSWLFRGHERLHFTCDDAMVAAVIWS
jgi:hypothetical protein